MNEINFISLKVKCPLCSKSLMDEDYKIDNEPSLKMFVEQAGKSGTIRLSSVYGSYNYLSDMDLIANEITKFYCPHCRQQIVSPENCNTCQAPMISLILDIGGKVSFCSRKGCQGHNLGFDDFSDAMKKLYQDFGYGSKVRLPNEEVFVPAKSDKVKTEAEDHKEIIESGSFLHVYCPHCLKSLIENDMLKFKVINEKDESGFIMISPYLNVFSSKTTIYIPEDKELKDVQCFHCEHSLKVPEKKCEKCGTQTFRVLVSARTKMIEFNLCSKKGCTWHGLSERDLEDIRLEDSDEW